MLAGAGCEVLGPVYSYETAIEFLDADRPDAVMLDLNLEGRSTIGLANHLRMRGIPFVLVTGYGETHLQDSALRGAPHVTKPYRAARLLAALAGILK